MNLQAIIHDLSLAEIGKLVTEEDLKEMDFEKKHVTAKESGDKPYTYYIYELINNKYEDLCLIADKVNGKWEVVLPPYTKMFTTYFEIKTLIELLRERGEENEDILD